MLPRLEYFDDEVDDELTRMLREGESGEVPFDDDDDDLMLDTQLMPAKHGSKSPMLASAGRPQVPSPYPSVPKQYASGVQKKAVPPPPPPRAASEPDDLSDLFGEIEDAESTGSDVAPIHRLDGGRVLPSSRSLAARRDPWVIHSTPPPFDSFAMQPVALTAPALVAEEKASHKGSAIFGGILGIACGILIVSIANGTLTAKSARSGLARATIVVDAVLAHH